MKPYGKYQKLVYRRRYSIPLWVKIFPSMRILLSMEPDVRERTVEEVLNELKERGTLPLRRRDKPQKP